MRCRCLHTDVPQCSIDAHNNPLTDEALSACKNADAIILGAVGGPVRNSNNHIYATC